MNKLYLLLALITYSAGCTMQPKNAEKNIALIENYVQSVEKMDFNAMELYLADTYIGVGPSLGDSTNKVEAIANWKQNVETLYESISYKRSRNIAAEITTGDNQGSWVSNWAELEIAFKNEPGTVTILANTLYQIVNGKIVKSYTIYNEADALEQMGYVIINLNDLPNY